jgi:CHRD domain/PEP-CTERM motif
MKRIVLLFAVVACCTVCVADTFNFNASLSGPAESPPQNSAGVGFATVSYNSLTHLLTVNVIFSGLVGTTTASHIHCCTPAPFSGTAGVATTTPTFAGFPLGVTSGTYSTTLDLTLASSFNPAFVTALGGSLAVAENTLITGMLAGESYLNIHTSFAPGGEIRGFLVLVPEPATLTLIGIGSAAALLRRRKVAKN